MSRHPQDELRRLVHQLRAELEWAARTGIEVTIDPPEIPPEVLAEPPPVPALPVDAGRPAPPETETEAAKAPVNDEPPPAFEPDPEEAAEPAIPVVSPSQAARRAASAGRPWERYLDDGPPAETRRPAENRRPPENGRPAENRRPPPSPQGPPEVRRPAGSNGVPAAVPSAPPSPAAPGLELLPEASSLGQVREILGDCTRCKLHRAGRRQIVFGVGNPQAELMFIGEGPGQQEDLQGEPFVGAAGELLTKIIENGMRRRRSEVYIANIVKCRPPGNRDPEPDEVEACEPFLRAQIQQVKPKVIVALGKYAAQTLLRKTTSISRLRGTWHIYEGIDLMPTFHPAYVLRDPTPQRKKPVWDDMQEVMKKLGWSLAP